MVTLERVGYNLRRVRQTVNTFANWQDAFRTMARKGPELSLTLRGILEQAGLRGYPKTSGQKGLHVLVPLGDHGATAVPPPVP